MPHHQCFFLAQLDPKTAKKGQGSDKCIQPPANCGGAKYHQENARINRMTCIFVRTAYDQLMPSLERYRGAPIAGERPSRPNCAHDSKNAQQRAENVCFDAVGSTEKLFVTGGNKSLPSAVSPDTNANLQGGRAALCCVGCRSCGDRWPAPRGGPNHVDRRNFGQVVEQEARG